MTKKNTKLIQDYLDESSFYVRENSNNDYAYPSFKSYLSGSLIAGYALDTMYNGEIGEAHKKGDIHIHDLSNALAVYCCFTGDTRVFLLDGTTPTLKELADRKDQYWVLSRDSEGNIVPSIAKNARLTRREEIIQVDMSGGISIKCTPDHKIMMRDGSFKEAKDLRGKDSIMPLYVSDAGRGYKVIKDSKIGLSEYLHRLVAKSHFNISDLHGKVVHHKNGNKSDNTPDNLEVLDDIEHRSLEMSKTMSTESRKQLSREQITARNKSEEHRELVSGVAINRKRDSKGRFYNHCVLRKPISIGYEEVYCLDVPSYGNFALADGIFVHNCGWSLRELLEEGFNGIVNRNNFDAPKHLRTACHQMANFLTTLQMEASGAQAFNCVDTFLAPYVKKGNLSHKEVKQCLQELVCALNIPFRSGEMAFTNFSFDLVCPKDLAWQNPKIGGDYVTFTYGDCQKEMDTVNKAFLEVMLEGDKNGRMFSFPIPTYSLTKSFNWESEVSDLIFKLSARYGSPYFQNFINSDLNPEDIRSMCCRLSLDLTQIQKSGSVFNSHDSTGSIGVCTINLPRIGALAATEEEVFQMLDERLELCKTALEIKRTKINEMLESGLFPYIKRWLPHKFSRHFSTIGVVGMYEFYMNFFEESVKYEEDASFAQSVMAHISRKLLEFQKETGHLYNLEETPAEGACYRFALLDKELNSYTSGDKDPYYTQGCKLPYGYTDDIFEVLDHQQDLSKHYSGGCVQHIFLGENIDSQELGGLAAKNLIKAVVSNYKMPYITLTPTFSICEEHGYIQGEADECPVCLGAVNVYSRIVGYYSAVVKWNKGKQSEFVERQTFKIDNI